MENEIKKNLVNLNLSVSDLQLVLTGLRFLLNAEDDPAEIERLKRLIDRLENR